MTSVVGLAVGSRVPSAAAGGCVWFWYWPEGVRSRLPSGVKVRRRKKDVRVSLAYNEAFFMPVPTMVVAEVTEGLGDASMGMTAGSGIDGAGDTERRNDEKDDRRLWLTTLGGFMGSAADVGVPGAEGTGDPMDGAGPPPAASMTDSWARWPKSGGAGLLDEMRRGGRSALMWLASLGVLSSVPSV